MIHEYNFIAGVTYMKSSAWHWKWYRKTTKPDQLYDISLFGIRLALNIYKLGIGFFVSLNTYDPFRTTLTERHYYMNKLWC